MNAWFWVAVSMAGGFLLFAGITELVERRRRRYIRWNLTIDTRPFVEAMQEVVIRLSELTTLRLKLRLSPRAKIQLAQDQVGMGNRTEDGLWQSDVCATWLHSSCPLPRHCDCRCHR